jgi:hypothetical protein
MNKEWAILLSGQPRASIESSYTDYLDLINDLDSEPDSFCHVMNSNKALTGFWQNPNFQVRKPEEVINLWKPKNSLIENYDDFNFKNAKSMHTAGGLSMTYGIKKVFEIMREYEEKNNFQYKYVVRYRYDLLLGCSNSREKRNLTSNNRYDNLEVPLFGKLKEPYLSRSCDFWQSNHLPDNSLLESIDDKIDWKWIKSRLDEGNTIIVSPGWNWGHSKACCDLFLMGSRDAMEKFSQYHNMYEELVNSDECRTNNEGVLGKYLKDIAGIRVLNYYFGDIGVYR